MEKKKYMEELERLKDKILLHEQTHAKLLDDIEFQKKQIAKLERALNKIAMIGSSELAYTGDFTEKAVSIARTALNVKENKWPY
jgi:hypothetical protein